MLYTGVYTGVLYRCCIQVLYTGGVYRCCIQVVYTSVLYGIIVFGISTVDPVREWDSALHVVSWQSLYLLSYGTKDETTQTHKTIF